MKSTTSHFSTMQQLVWNSGSDRRSWQLAVGVGSWQKAVGSKQLAVSRMQLAVSQKSKCQRYHQWYIAYNTSPIIHYTFCRL